MAKKGRKPKQPPEPQVEVILRTSHSINGKTYGPGRVLVPASTAAMLREQEQRVHEEDAAFHNKEPQAFLIGAGSRKVQVPADQFENLYHALPIGTASLRGFHSA